MANTSIVIKEVSDNVATLVKDLVSQGELQMPANYSAVNALKSAALILLTLETNQKIPVLEFCTPESIKNALFSMCKQGLDPDKQQCYFIPYGKSLTVSRSYFGDIAVVKRIDPTIEDVYAAVVFDGDKFDYRIKHGKIVEIEHSQKLGNKDNAIVGAYATIVYCDGREESDVMTIEQLKNAWKQSITNPVDSEGRVKATSVHGKFPETMAKRTVVRRACKMIFKTSDDKSLFARSVKESYDELDAISIEAGIEEEANQIEIEPEYVDVVMELAEGEVDPF